jgi:hypothetical protein
VREGGGGGEGRSLGDRRQRRAEAVLLASRDGALPLGGHREGEGRHRWSRAGRAERVAAAGMGGRLGRREREVERGGVRTEQIVLQLFCFFPVWARGRGVAWLGGRTRHCQGGWLAERRGHLFVLSTPRRRRARGGEEMKISEAERTWGLLFTLFSFFTVSLFSRSRGRAASILPFAPITARSIASYIAWLGALRQQIASLTKQPVAPRGTRWRAAAQGNRRLPLAPCVWSPWGRLAATSPGACLGLSR